MVLKEILRTRLGNGRNQSSSRGRCLGTTLIPEQEHLARTLPLKCSGTPAIFRSPFSLPRRSHLHGVDWDMEWLDIVDIRFRLYLTRRKQWLKGNQRDFQNRNRCQGSTKQCERGDKCCHYKRNPFSMRLESRQTWTTCAPSKSFQGHSLPTHPLNNSSNVTASSLCSAIFP